MIYISLKEKSYHFTTILVQVDTFFKNSISILKVLDQTNKNPYIHRFNSYLVKEIFLTPTLWNCYYFFESTFYAYNLIQYSHEIGLCVWYEVLVKLHLFPQDVYFSLHYLFKTFLQWIRGVSFVRNQRSA